MACRPADLKKLFPEFEPCPTSRIQMFIDQAERRINRSAFCEYADDAVCYLAAHLLAMADRSGIGGAVSSEKVGDLSRSYSSKETGGQPSLQSTSYGQLYYDLMLSCRKSPRVLGCKNP